MYRFRIAKGNENPLLDILFKIILILSVLVFFLHKSEIGEGKNEVMKQTNLFKYFNEKV